MKLLRFGPAGRERPGLLDADGTIRDLSSVIDDIAGDVLSDEGLASLREIDTSGLPAIDPGVRLGPPLTGIGQLLGVGLNYADHAKEAGLDAPAEPILFNKAVSCICGPGDDIELPPDAGRADWEVELAIVIGKRAKRVSASEALDYVAGYCICNDVSERAWQFKTTGQWIKGKSWETFGPLGPWLVTRDEVPDPQNLTLTLDLNGERRQDGHTSKMLFTAAQIIEAASRYMTLLPGDVIATGTPAGVGGASDPRRYLTGGDELKLTVEGLGAQTAKVVTG